MAKQDSRYWRKKCVAVAKQIVYIRDANTCQKCGVVVSGKNRHASHVISEGRSKLLSCDVHNMKVLCNNCHKWRHNNPDASIAWFVSTYPKRRDYLTNKFITSNGSIGSQYYIDKLNRLEHLFNSYKSIIGL